MKWNIWIVELNDYKRFNGENCEYTLSDLVMFLQVEMEQYYSETGDEVAKEVVRKVVELFNFGTKEETFEYVEGYLSGLGYEVVDI